MNRIKFFAFFKNNTVLEKRTKIHTPLQSLNPLPPQLQMILQLLKLTAAFH